MAFYERALAPDERDDGVIGDDDGDALELAPTFSQASILSGSSAVLGTSIINALAQTLEARVYVSSGAEGTTVSVTHATFEMLH